VSRAARVQTRRVSASPRSTALTITALSAAALVTGAPVHAASALDAATPNAAEADPPPEDSATTAAWQDEAAQAEPSRYRDVAARQWGVGLDAMFGAQHLELDAFSELLRQEGFAGLNTTPYQYGFQLGFLWKRFRLGLDFVGGSLTTHYLEDGSRLGISALEAGPYLGYDVFRYRGFTVLTRVAYVVGGLNLNDDSRHLPSFARDAAQRYPLDGIEAGYGAIALQVGTEQFVPLYRGPDGHFGLTFGATLGHAWNVHHRQWETVNIHDPDADGHRVLGGPELDGAGWRFRSNLGVAIYVL